MASVALSRRVGKVLGSHRCPSWPTTSVARSTRRCSDADNFEDLPGKWQAAILEAEQSLPKLRVV